MKYAETGEVIAAMGIVAAMIREAVHEKGIDVGLPEEFRYDEELFHFRLDVPVGDQVVRVS